MHTVTRTTALAFALATLSACAGFDQDEFGSDLADRDGDEHGRDGAGAEGQDGGDDEGRDECDRPERAGDGDGHGDDGDGNDDDGEGGRDCGDGDENGDGDEGGEPERDDDHLEQDVCEPHSTDLIAGQHFDTGSVTVSNSKTALSLSLLATAPYQIVEAHAYVGVDPIPLTNGGMAAPGQFPYQVNFDEPADAWQLEIPLSELEVGCGADLNVAVHAVVVAFVDGMEVFEETAWAFGPEQFDAGWGWSFDYEICCARERGDEDDSCTLTQGYWKTHHAHAEQASLQQPWPISEDTQLCGQSWLDILYTEPEGDTWLILAHQAIAAQLNVASGATTTDEVDAAMAGAQALLGNCAIADADAQAALEMATLLDEYNNGVVGPGHCE